MGRFLSYTLIVISIFHTAPLVAVKYVHQCSDTGNVDAIYVSQSTKHAFQQDDYSYDFMFCDDEDSDILETLGTIFGQGTHATRTIGTYSISIDHTSLEDDYVYRQSGYLVEDDMESTNASTENLECNVVPLARKGRLIFISGNSSSPTHLIPQYFTEDKINFSKASEPSHMENALLASLYHNSTFFNRVKQELPEDCQILGVCIKLYSSYDFCRDCRANILHLYPYLRSKFAHLLGIEIESLPLSILGLTYRLYGLTYKGAEEEPLGGQDYWTALYNKDLFKSFSGNIHGDFQQDFLPIFVCKQPDTPQDEELFLESHL